MMYVLRSQDNLQQSASSFHRVDPKDWTQFVRLAWQVLFGVISLSPSPFGRAEGQKGYQWKSSVWLGPFTPKKKREGLGGSQKKVLWALMMLDDARCLGVFFLTVSQEEEVPKTSLGRPCNSMVTSVPSAQPWSADQIYFLLLRCLHLMLAVMGGSLSQVFSWNPKWWRLFSHTTMEARLRGHTARLPTGPKAFSSYGIDCYCSQSPGSRESQGSWLGEAKAYAGLATASLA